MSIAKTVMVLLAVWNVIQLVLVVPAQVQTSACNAIKAIVKLKKTVST